MVGVDVWVAVGGEVTVGVGVNVGVIVALTEGNGIEVGVSERSAVGVLTCAAVQATSESSRRAVNGLNGSW